MNYDKPFITSGRNTIIHKMKKLDLLIINRDGDPAIVVSQTGIRKYDGVIPRNRAEAKKAYLEVINLGTVEIFGETKKLLFVQSLDNKEYKIDYTKVNTPNFIKVHQDSYL